MITFQNKVEFLLEDYLDSLVKSNVSFVLYRLPGTSCIHLIVSTNAQRVYIKDIDLSEMKGFLVSPFVENNDFATYLIPKDYHILLEKIEGRFFIVEEFGFKPINLKENYTSIYNYVPPVVSDNFREKTTLAKTLLLQNAFKKIVLSRTKYTKLNRGFSITQFFENLLDAYPNAFVNIFKVPNSGVWIGATPEILVRQTVDMEFQTVALAGTQRADSVQSVSQVSWTQKEIEEQALVSRYIIDCFKKIRLREYEDIGPKTVNVGNLYHLKTEFRVNINAVNYPQLTTVMLKLLHPTSAVCGMPLEESRRFILENESEPRAYYAGFIGPVNMPPSKETEGLSTDIFVNIRCMKLENGFAKLYAGVGLTADSDIDKEWEETEAKFDTLARFL